MRGGRKSEGQRWGKREGKGNRTRRAGGKNEGLRSKRDKTEESEDGCKGGTVFQRGKGGYSVN